MVRIETPRGFGTGFICFTSGEGQWCGVATAHHVIAAAHEWREPIQLHQPGQTPVFLNYSDRYVFNDPVRDSSIVLVKAEHLAVPTELIPLRPIADRLPFGAEVGWLGFPAVTSIMCFFKGCISAFQQASHSYLIDGVAINGVSGGPVLFLDEIAGLQIVGAVTAYIPNRASGEALPGLAQAQDVSHFHDVDSVIKAIDAKVAAENTSTPREEPPHLPAPPEG